jgi:dipeptidyl aminopeptidase/acylaminoacyl peptidase
MDWSADANCLLICQFAQAVQQLYLFDLATWELTKLSHLSGTFDSPGTCFVGKEIYAQLQDAAHPAQLIALNAQTGEKTRTVLAAGGVPPGHAWKSISFPSSDGQMIQGWLGYWRCGVLLPSCTHGGPGICDDEMYSPSSQGWIDHGFAFLTINFRAQPLWPSISRKDLGNVITGR